MSQYDPAGLAHRHPTIDRCLTTDEYREAVAIAKQEGLWRFDKG